jgi:hypothetical protein
VQPPRDTRLDEGVVVGVGRAGRQRCERSGRALEVREQVVDPPDSECLEPVGERRCGEALGERGRVHAQGMQTADEQQIVAAAAPARVDQLAAGEHALEARNHGEQGLRIHREAIDPEREAAPVREPGSDQPEELLGEQTRRARSPGMAGCTRSRRSAIASRRALR